MRRKREMGKGGGKMTPKRSAPPTVCALLLILCAVFISGCAAQREKTKETDKTEVVDIYITLTMNENLVPDLEEVTEKVNEITEEKIGVRMKILPVSEARHSSEITEMISQNKPVDIIITLGIKSLIESGYLLPLDGLLQRYGQDILKSVDQKYMELAKYNGVQYSIVKNRELATQYAICMRKDLLEKYGFSAGEIKDVKDFEKVLETIHAGEPDLNLYEPQIVVDGDELGDKIGVLMGDASTPEMVNFYETQEFIEQIRAIREWRKKGYIPGDGVGSSLYNKVRLQEMMKSGKLFSFLILSKPGIESQEGMAVGYELVSFPVTRAVITTSSALRRQWGIASTSQHPVEAMKLLNLLYTDREIADLLCWGIEGKHYVVTEDGTLDYPDGINASNTGYNFDQNWQLPGRYLASSWRGEIPNLRKAIDDFNRAAYPSCALGFQFDISDIKDKYEAVIQTAAPYLRGFERGSFEVDEVYPEFIEKLEQAGIEEIIEEKQRQLDEWMEQQRIARAYGTVS